LVHNPQPQFIVGYYNHELNKDKLQSTTNNIKDKPITSHNQQPTIHKQIQSWSECTKLLVINDILRSFDLENNHENLEQQEYNPFDYFL
jgi:hypothetical protein